ncbi:MAG: MetQ/NlpA family ABC transporter substrate-binding protein, partial [Mucispirillum sp.]|nr:MetQ/NlpA family ABC transporter substrate-binding protein [Mucispirillum sp.]
VSAGKIHFEPLGIYAGKSESIENIKEGAVIGIPNDPTNGARALWLLDELGILKINKNKGFEATELDIIDNPKKITIKAMEAAQLPVSLPDLDFAVINGNYALGAGVLDKVIVGESSTSTSASTFGNIIAVRESDLNNPQIQKIVEILKSEPVKQYIKDTYKGVVIPLD